MFYKNKNVSRSEYVYIVYHFVTKNPALIVNVSGEIAVKRLSLVSSAGTNSWRPQNLKTIAGVEIVVKNVADKTAEQEVPTRCKEQYLICGG